MGTFTTYGQYKPDLPYVAVLHTETLTDGSKVYDVVLARDADTKVTFNCTSYERAVQLCNALNDYGISGFHIDN